MLKRCLACVLFLGCGGESLPDGCDFLISPGEDDQTAIQAAFIDAADGETVCLDEGTFTLSDPLEISGRTDFTLRGAGAGATILDFSSQATGGAGIDMMGMTRLVVEEFKILDAQGNGLRINASEDLVIRHVHAGWTTPADPNSGKYAIYPVSSTHVLVEDCVAYNSADAGIYIGQVTGCIVRRNEAYGNVAGIEIENSAACEVYENEAHDNTGGLLVFELPGLPMTGGGTLVRNNDIRDNNLLNFGDPGSVVGLVPTGTGLFVLAAHDVEVRDNTIENNRSLGVAVISYATILALEESPAPEDYDPFISGIFVHDNSYMDNGGMPGSRIDGQPDALQELAGAIELFGGETIATLENVVFDGFLPPGGDATELCLGETPATFRDLAVPTLEEEYMGSTDSTPHVCTHEPQPAITLPFEGS